MRSLLIIVGFMLVAVPVCAGSRTSSEVNRHIQSLVDRLEDAYQTLDNAQYRNSIAVFDLADDSPQAATKNLGMACSQLLTTRLSQSRRFYVVERLTLQKVVDEMRLGMTGLVDEATAAKAGKLVGADIIVVGSVSEVGEYFNVNIRMVEVETSHLLVSAMEEIPRDLLIESAGSFRPPSYRVGITGHVFSETGDVDRLTGWLGLFYSKELAARLLADGEVGWVFATNLEDQELVEAEPPIDGYTQQMLAVGGGPFFSTRIHLALVNRKTIRVTTYAGLSVFQLSYDYRVGTEQGPVGEYLGSDSEVMLSSPVGICLHLQPRREFSYRLSFGYLLPLNELRVQYPEISREPLRELSASMSGPSASASLVMYF